MITREYALAICEQQFPDGLNRLISEFGIVVLEAALTVDGWGFQNPKGEYKIRLNTNSTKERKKFTIAHELAHFILHGGESFFLESLNQYDPKSPAEREANDLASELLLPRSRMQSMVRDKLVDNELVKKLAKTAKVSEIVVALRLIKMSGDLGICRSAVHSLRDGAVEWSSSIDPVVSDEYAVELYNESRNANMVTLRKRIDSEKVLIAFPLSNPTVPTLFTHVVDKGKAVVSPETSSFEDAKSALLAADENFYKVLNGKIGGWTGARKNLHFDDAWEQFLCHYNIATQWNTEEELSMFLSDACMDFLYLKFRRIYPRD